MDSLVLKGLKFRGLHGFYEQEQKAGNDFEVDIRLELSLEEAGTTDDLSKTVDYQQIYLITKKVMLGPSVQLIERLAFLIGKDIYQQFRPRKLTVKVRKISPPIAAQTEYSEVSLQWPR
jgi:dihydroneopterin aldolase